MNSLRLPRVILAAFFGLLATAGAETTVTWPIPTPPPGTNPAVFPVPRDDWMIKFQANLNRAKAGPVDLLFQGDSITDFWTKAPEVWNAHYGKLNAATFGISGDKTENVLWRLQHGEMKGLHPKLIVLMIGTNNLAHGTTVPQTVAGIQAIVADLRKRSPESHILLLGIFPRAETPADPLRAAIQQTNQAISKLDDGKHITYLDIGNKFLRPDGTLSKDIMPDFLHPSVAGYQIWADAIQPEIDQFFPPKS